MSFPPCDALGRLDAVLAGESAAAHPLGMHVGVERLFFPAEQKPTTRVKAR